MEEGEEGKRETTWREEEEGAQVRFDRQRGVGGEECARMREDEVGRGKGSRG